MIKVIPGITLFVGIGIGFATAASITACANRTPFESSGYDAKTSLPWKTQQRNVESIVDPNDGESFAELLSELEEKRAVFVGETHDRYDHHLNQLAIIRGLHERGVDLAVGMEFFQAPFQPVLDQYVAGEIEEKEFLRKTEYYERWKYDYRLYRDILVYARNNGISLVALNAPSELVARVSKGGIAGLTAEERALLPIDLPSPGSTYIDRLRQAARRRRDGPSRERYDRICCSLAATAGLSALGRVRGALRSRLGPRLVLRPICRLEISASLCRRGLFIASVDRRHGMVRIPIMSRG